MKAGRWEDSKGQCAYTITSNQGGKYRATTLSSWYRPVCEDATATTTQVTVETPTTPTTEAVVDGCNGQQYEDNKVFRMANYRMTEVLCSVVEIGQTKAASLLDCARRCLRATGCCSFALNKNTKVCRHFRFVRGREDSLCQAQESCFTFV